MRVWIALLLASVVAALALPPGQSVSGRKVQAASIVAVATPVDTFLDFHSETVGQQTSLAFHQSSYGDTNWILTSCNACGTNRTYFSNVVGSDLSFPGAITIGGAVFTSTGTKWVRETLNITNDYAMLQFDYPQSILSEMIVYLQFSGISNLVQNSRDLFEFRNNPYVVSQSGINASNDVTPTFGIHTGGGGTAPSSVFAVPPLTALRLELVEDNTNNLAYVRVKRADTGALIGTSITYSNGINSHQDKFQIFAGYIALAGVSGYFDFGAVSMNYSYVNTNRPPWVPNAPSLVTATQTGDGQVTVSVTDSNDRLNYHHIDIWNSGTWTNNITNIVVGATNVVITGLSGGSNYNFRAYATGPLVTDVPSAKVESGAITLSSAAWYDNVAFASVNDSETQDQTYKNLAVPVTVSSSGNATKLRVAIASTSSENNIPIKVALYDGSRALLASVTTTIGTADVGTQKEFTISSTAVTSGTYYVGWTVNSTAVTFGSITGTSGTEMHFFNTSFSYAAYPPSNLGTSDGTLETVSAGVLVQ